MKNWISNKAHPIYKQDSTERTMRVVRIWKRYDFWTRKNGGKNYLERWQKELGRGTQNELGEIRVK